uniref:Amino acid transporter transmembrane domain-containing protein n=1 Tax=Globodera rostochiensis TaxID=31243 RepID=A0A914HHB8_GLORO
MAIEQGNRSDEEVAVKHIFGADEDSQAASEEQRSLKTAGLTTDSTGAFVREKGLSYFAVLISFLKTLVGAGFLALPLAFKEAGHWSGLTLLIVASLLNYYGMTQLVECTQFHYRRLNIPYISYGNLAKEACRASFPWAQPHGILAKRIVNASILVLEFGFCSTYYLFIATTLQELLCVLDINAWLVIIFIPIAVLTFIRSLRVLSVFSLIGNILMLISLAFILYKLIAKWQPIDHLKSWNTFDGLLTASGTIIFSFEAQTLVLPLEKKLKRPKQMLGFFGILSGGIFIATIIYGSVGFLGYVAYGDNVKGSITQNLERKELPIILVKAALCLSIFSCFLLQMYVIIEVMWSRTARMIIVGENAKRTHVEEEKQWWQLPPSFKFPCELMFRVLMVAVCFSFAVAVPDLERIIPLVGSTTGMLLAFVFPALIDLFTFVPFLLKEGQQRKAHLRLCINILLTCVGLFGMVAGLKANISEMMKPKNTTSIVC